MNNIADDIQKTYDSGYHEGYLMGKADAALERPATNYDRIKVMSVDEMAEFLEAETYDSCEHTASWYTEWLNSPAEGGADIIRTGSPGNFRTNSGRLWLNDWQAQD